MNVVEKKTFSMMERQDLPPVFLFLQKSQRLLFFLWRIRMFPDGRWEKQEERNSNKRKFMNMSK